MYQNNQYNRFNSRKNEKGYSVRFARQLGLMLIVFLFLMLIKLVVNETTQKINSKIREVFYSDLTDEATEVFKSRLGDSIGLKGESSGENNEFFIEFLPAEGKITRGFGKFVNEETKKEEMHNGIELEVKEGTEVKCVYNGVVESIQLDTTKGNSVTISHQGGFKTIYTYLTDLIIEEGDTIEKGKSIGTANAQKNAKTILLYFEVQKNGIAENPEDYMKALTN